MSDARPHWPKKLRPFVHYDPPIRPQSTRSSSAREVWADVRHFLDRAAQEWKDTGTHLQLRIHRWSTESARGKHANFFGEWPAECSIQDFEAAMQLAHERFGEPRYRMDARRLESEGMLAECVWLVPVHRADELLDFLDRVPNCIGGEWPPVTVSYTCLFLLRDLATASVMPRQSDRFYPMQSTLSVYLQRDCWATLQLTLPFAEPDTAVADYVVALQEHAPVWIDPRYFDHMVPAHDGSRFNRRRLPPTWIGATAAGEPRLDATRSGIIPAQVDLPTEAELAAEDRSSEGSPFHMNYRALAAALRDGTNATIVVRGDSDADYMMEKLAQWLSVPLHVIQTVRLKKGGPSVEEELRTIVSGVDERHCLLLLEISGAAKHETNAALLSQMGSRVLLGVPLPPELRLVVAVDAEPSERARTASERYGNARMEGFATRAQIEFLEREQQRAGWRDVVVEVLPLPA